MGNTLEMKSQENVKETHNSKSNGNTELIKRQDVKDSPFQIITTETGSFGVMGKWRITEMKDKPEEIKEELEEITWNRIIQVIMLITEKNNKNQIK